MTRSASGTKKHFDEKNCPPKYFIEDGVQGNFIWCGSCVSCLPKRQLIICVMDSWWAWTKLNGKVVQYAKETTFVFSVSKNLFKKFWVMGNVSISQTHNPRIHFYNPRLHNPKIQIVNFGQPPKHLTRKLVETQFWTTFVFSRLKILIRVFWKMYVRLSNTSTL